MIAIFIPQATVARERFWRNMLGIWGAAKLREFWLILNFRRFYRERFYARVFSSYL